MKLYDYKKEFIHEAVRAKVSEIARIRNSILDKIVEDVRSRKSVIDVAEMEEFEDFCDMYLGNRVRQMNREQRIRILSRRAAGKI